SLAAPRGGAIRALGRPCGANERPPRSLSLAAPRGGAIRALGRPCGANSDASNRQETHPLALTWAPSLRRRACNVELGRGSCRRFGRLHAEAEVQRNDRNQYM